MSGTGTGTPATAAAGLNKNTIVVIGDFTPGQVFTIVFVTVEQAKSLPNVPADALRIAIAPAGGI